MPRRILLLTLGCLMLLPACEGPGPSAPDSTALTLVTLAPGHFHAALVQKQMYPLVDSNAYIYAPEGPDVGDHLDRIEGYNTREANPTHWISHVYTGPDFLQKMLEEDKGDLVILAGNNQQKTEYILAAIQDGRHVLSDKPMAITPEDFSLLEEAFSLADSQQVLLYDIMTERHEVSTQLQKAFSQFPDLFGTLEPGTPEDPSVVKESVHHFFKYVSGNPIKRPPWYFDVTQQGEGIVDVSTHLVDLIQWACFPEEIIRYPNEIQMLQARRWATPLTPSMFQKVTRLDSFPAYLSPYLDQDSVLSVYANGEMTYRVKGVHARVSVIWNFEAPEGGGDTHYSIMKGSKAHLLIRQGADQGFRPTLYILPAPGIERESLAGPLENAIEALQATFEGVGSRSTDEGWEITVPDRYQVGHEAHFGQVAEKFLGYLQQGTLPAWEVPNMLAKYYTLMEAYKMSHQAQD